MLTRSLAAILPSKEFGHRNKNEIFVFEAIKKREGERYTEARAEDGNHSHKNIKRAFLKAHMICSVRSTQISSPIETFLSLKYLGCLTNDDDILNSYTRRYFLIKFMIFALIFFSSSFMWLDFLSTSETEL